MQPSTCYPCAPNCMDSVKSQDVGKPIPRTSKESSKPKNELNFPARLHYMLGELKKDGLDHIISWRPHGRAFRVVDPAAFASEVLPLWFRQSKYSSFQRQLNLYGFKRITSGNDKGCHYHEHFIRGMPDMASKIERTKAKGTGIRRSGSSEKQPNFYTHSQAGQAQITPETVLRSESFVFPREVSLSSIDNNSSVGSGAGSIGSPLFRPPSCDNLLGLAHTAALALELMKHSEECTDKKLLMRQPAFYYRPSMLMEQLSHFIRYPLHAGRMMESTTEQHLLALTAGGVILGA